MDTTPSVRTQHFIVMGVCGCGKSTIGSQLAEKIYYTFFDGDDFHPPENIDKMQNGIPLNDEDRYSWLVKLQELIKKLSSSGVSSVIACSALRASYRALLMQAASHHTHIAFIWITVPQNIITKRLKKRKKHFMSPTLIQSQFDTLEQPNPEQEDITVYVVDGSQSIDTVMQNTYAEITK